MLPFLAAAGKVMPKGNVLKKAGLAVGIVALVGVGVYYYKKKQSEKNVEEASKAYGTNTTKGKAVEYAGLFKTALNSGWFGMTENEEALYSAAIKMHQNSVSFGDVSTAYKQLYNEDLLPKINKLLSAEEQAIFNNAINGKYKTVAETSTKTSAAQTAWTVAKITNPLLNVVDLFK